MSDARGHSYVSRQADKRKQPSWLQGRAQPVCIQVQSMHCMHITTASHPFATLHEYNSKSVKAVTF